MYYNIFFFCMLALYVYNLPIFVLHKIVFNVLSDNKNCYYKTKQLNKQNKE